MAFPTTYLDFLAGTRDIKMTTPDTIVNEAMSQSYILTEMIRGRDMSQISKGGSALVDYIQVATNGSSSVYRPGESLTPVSADTMKKISLTWKHSQANYTFLEEEVLLNDNDPDHFFKLETRYESGAVTDYVNFLENSILWGVPSNADMEDDGGKQPYSLPVFVNEYTNTLPTGFSTIMTLSPATTTVWQNQKQGYSAANAENPTHASGILNAMDNVLQQVEFEPVPFGNAKQFQETDNLRKLMIATSLDGINMYKRILRASNDRTVTPQDAAYSSPTFAGYRLKRVNALETAAIYTGVGLAASHTSGVANTGYARYYFLNTNYLYPIFNKDRFFEKREPINGGINKPTTWAQYYFTMLQIWCSSRRRQGIVYPSAA
jgi:hypothetical protein